MAADITLDTLRLFVNERLTAVAEDIVEVFVRTIFQYQQEIDIQRRQLDSLNVNNNSEVKAHVSDFFPVCKKEADPEQQQDRIAILVQKEPKIELELEEFLYWPEQGDKLTVTVQTVKTNVNNDDDHTVKTHDDQNGETDDEHTKPPADVYEYENCGASQPSSHVQPLSSHCSDSDTEDSDEWEETRESPSHKRKSSETPIVDTVPLNHPKSSNQTPHGANHRGTKRRPYVCSHCGKKFARSASMKVHMATHSTEKPFSCKVCGKAYALKLHLIGHMRRHKEENASSCTICGEQFTGSEHVQAHMMTHAGENKPVKKEQLSCEVCGKMYLRNIHLMRHMRTHKAGNATRCTVCGEEFTERGHLKAHMATHTPPLEQKIKRKEKKPFRCTVCRKKYARHVHMIKHMATHVKAENASSCTVGGKEFTQSIHLKAHTGDKPFRCTLCGRGFSLQKNLARHTWTHAREKPFHCTGCGKGYIEMCDLRKHLRTSICGRDHGVQVYATNT